MSLSTLLEAAKYLDYLDSSQNNNNNPTNQINNQQQQLQHQQQQPQINRPINPAQAQAQLQNELTTQGQNIIRKSASKSAPRRRPRATKKNDMLAMSLPSSSYSSASLDQRGVPISDSFTGAGYKSPPIGLSCSYTPGSPQSSPTSIALLSSKTSGVTSNISSAASSLSSSDSSSSCGEILMSELDFNQCATSVSSNCSIPNSSSNHHLIQSKNQTQHQYNNHLHLQQQQQQQQISHMSANIELLTNIQQLNNHNYSSNNNQLTHPFNDANTTTYYGGGPVSSMPQPITGGNDKRATSRRKTSKSAGPKMTLTSNQSIASTSVPLDGSLHAGRVFQAGSVLDPTSGHIKFAAQPAHRSSGSALDIHGSSSYMSMSNNCFNAVCSGGGLINQASSPQAGSLIMARVQPMILNSLGPPAHQSIMAFQQATAPSPTSTSSSYSRHRELHKTLEKNRRAHLRHCFELLKAELPGSECVDRKTSHINIIKSAIRCVLSLIEQGANLERELQTQMEIKSRLTKQLANFKDNLSSHQQPVAEQQLSFLLSRSKID